MTKRLLILLILLSAFLRLCRLDFPKAYVFDEVYHAYTAKEYLKGNKEAWSPWGKATEPKVAFEWLHPPIAKELMTASMFMVHSTEPWAWRLPGALLGILSIWLIYKLAWLLFKNEVIALTSAFIFSFDGLVFVQSRTGMNDVYLVAFILISLIFFVQKRLFASAVFAGIAIATKWSGVYLLPIYGLAIFYKHRLNIKLILHEYRWFLILVPMVYLLSYAPYFYLGYHWQDFIELNHQIWWYQTHLKATHDYSSPAYTWPLSLVPVWYYVQYFPNNLVANIFAAGVPIVFWGGLISIVLTVINWFKKRSANLLLVILGYFGFFLPWMLSPRIMFLYHFAPSVPFLCLAYGYQLFGVYQKKDERKWFWLIIGLVALNFAFYFSFLTGLPLPRNASLLFFMTNLAKNPF